MLCIYCDAFTLIGSAWGSRDPGQRSGYRGDRGDVWEAGRADANQYWTVAGQWPLMLTLLTGVSLVSQEVKSTAPASGLASSCGMCGRRQCV